VIDTGLEVGTGLGEVGTLTVAATVTTSTACIGGLDCGFNRAKILAACRSLCRTGLGVTLSLSLISVTSALLGAFLRAGLGLGLGLLGLLLGQGLELCRHPLGNCQGITA
jgi:hypothetical protein